MTFLAPVDCLQYFTASSGRVSSFNWMDVVGTRQLNNQNYNICFRTELISSQVEIILNLPNEVKIINVFKVFIEQKANQICLSTCTVTNGDAFSITTPPAVDLVGSGLTGFATNFNAALNSAIGTTYTDQTRPSGITVATCLYDYLLIPRGRDANNVEADRYCGNELNPSPGSVNFVNVPCGNNNNIQQPGYFISGAETSVQVCSKSIETFFLI